MSNDSLREALKDSAAARGAMLKKYGFIPMSILSVGRGKLSKLMFAYQGETPTRRSTADPKNKAKQAKLAEAGYIPAKNSPSRRQNAGKKGASIMPAELVQFFIKYYAEPGMTYLDPFMGQGVQMQVAKLNGLHYMGYDLSTEFFRFIVAVQEKINDGKTNILTVHGDSRSPDSIPDNIGDFCFTSPPYWDIEDYGDEPGQLGKQDYGSFLAGMQMVAENWLPKFKDGAFFVCNVGDFVREGQYIPYHADTIALFMRAGWKMHDVWVLNGVVGGLLRVFAVQQNSHQRAPKIHEFALVFRK